jgi:hypothetical protein
MKKTFRAPNSVPRLNSLLHRLQKTPGPEDEPYLDQLMMFLDDPPPDAGDRWKKGAKMCAEWGIATTGTSVWRLYRSYMIEWRARIALHLDDLSVQTPETLGQKAERLIALRSCELLANPDSDPATLVSLARMNLRQEALDFARQKHSRRPARRHRARPHHPHQTQLGKPGGRVRARTTPKGPRQRAQ